MEEQKIYFWKCIKCGIKEIVDDMESARYDSDLHDKEKHKGYINTIFGWEIERRAYEDKKRILENVLKNG
jgi:hypothetical protein